jgi:hypothetical protein
MDGQPGNEIEVVTPDPKKRLRSRLEFADAWAPEPFTPGQDIEYPDTIRVLRQAPELLRVSDAKDMDRYSELQLSTLRRGRFLILAEDRHWHEGEHLIVLFVQERQFKTLATTTSPPDKR